RVNGMVRSLKADHPDVEVCVCLGFVDDEKAASIKEAGADAYNHNANTARSHYGEICSTHSYEDRMDTVEVLKRNGLSPCSGVIAGMGETDEEFVDVIFDLRKHGVDSVPV
ncbi:radical SAM protein, partial [Xanthomonas citri pv. citri]|nr:radical SAM protein [Xanthomonas citri pv. citri]